MDSRLASYDGVRPVPLLRSDLEPIARAIADAQDGKAQIVVSNLKGDRFIGLRGNGYFVAVLMDDWAKILPFLKDGFFQAVEYSIPHRTDQFMPGPSDQEPGPVYPLYQRILLKLQELFPRDWPGGVRR